MIEEDLMVFSIILEYLEVSGVVRNLITQIRGISDYIVITRKQLLEMMENAMVFQLESLKIKPWVLYCFCVRFV